jgi:N-acetyl-gamma-glutamyl-phosphate reductase
MGVRVAVAGASGYAGGELLRLIHGHPGMELGPVTADSSAGSAVTDLHPHLSGLSGRVIEATEPGLLAAADLVFLALPHEQSATVAGRLPAGVKVVDLSASFRLADPAAWAAFYQGAHAGAWTYGLPELPGARVKIMGSSRVAAPGCHATAAILALAPLLARGIAEPRDIVVTSASGTSGAGRSPARHLLATEIIGSMSPYQVGGGHRHTPEIEQALAGVAAGEPAISFTPLLAPMARGILATCTARLTSSEPGAAAARQALAEAYADEPFVHLLPEGRWPATAATAGSNAIQLQAVTDTHVHRAIVVAAIDNLGKGAAGQAVQAANLMLGLPEEAGLTAHGIAP